VGKLGGALAGVRPDDLAAVPIRAVVERSGIDPATIDDVVLGCSNQAGEDSRNVARMAALLAGLPVQVPGQTVNRLCGSGLQAVASAAQAIRAGEGTVFVAGGVESMSRAPRIELKSGEQADSTIGWRFVNPSLEPAWTIPLGATAELLARRYEISRAAQEAYAIESQRRVAEAQRACVFSQEIIPVPLPDGSLFSRDEHPRPDTTLAAMAKLKPAFVDGGTVTAATSTGINDGAAALLVTAARDADVRIVASAVAGVDPSCMGLGPVAATRKVLERAGLTVDQLDLIELGEAFAAQAIACIRALDLDPARVNIYGGDIALGHPLGASGARMLTTLVHALRRTRGRYGLATMCISVGQGIALIVEHA
jgi:acetyl-CoA acetyltransferase family protein